MVYLMMLAVLAIKIGIPILLIIFLVKGIKYLNSKNNDNNTRH